MSIDIRSEFLLTLSEAANYLPKRPHISTLHRWRLRGAYGHRLETIVIGGRRYTSREALERFIARTTAAADGEPVVIRTPVQFRQAVEQAERELEKDGI